MNDMTNSALTRFVKLGIITLFTLLSAICAVAVIYHFIKVPTFRRRFPNQILFILVFIVSFEILFNIPTVFSYLIRGSVLIANRSFCRTWQFFENLITASIIWCEAIFTLERYLLVFHPNCLRFQRQKLILHYIPLLTINFYLILFYFLAFFVVQCEKAPVYHEMSCGVQCLDDNDPLSLFSWIFNTVLPIFIIIVGSIFLLVRVLWTRRVMHQSLRNWSRNRKMTIQLLGIALIYVVIWLPLSIVSLLGVIADEIEVVERIEYHWYFSTYICELSVPIIVLFLSPEVMQRLCRRFRPNRPDIGSITLGRVSTY